MTQGYEITLCLDSYLWHLNNLGKLLYYLSKGRAELAWSSLDKARKHPEYTITAAARGTPGVPFMVWGWSSEVYPSTHSGVATTPAGWL